MGFTRDLTSLTKLSIPSESPVTALRFGPKKTKNFFNISATPDKFSSV